MLRTQISEAVKTAMREKNREKLNILRLIQAAIKDADINARAESNFDGIDDTGVLNVLQKMIKQRQQSIATYEEAGRSELADQEKAEIVIIQEFMPAAMSEDEVKQAIDAVIAETGASSIKDMGTVMGKLRENYSGRMDFGAAGALIKQKLGA